MSGIAKPHLFFSTAISPQDDTVIPVDWIYTMEKVDIAASPVNNNKASYLIIVNLVPAVGAATRVEKINFATSTARNTAFTNAKALISTSV